MAKLAELWRNSLSFRRLVAVSVFLAATSLVYLGSEIPRSVALPVDDLNARTIAHFGEESFVLNKPSVAEGEVVLSYVGDKDELADFWLENALLDPASERLLFPANSSVQPSSISFTATDTLVPIKYDDTCRTTIIARRAKGSPAIESLRIYQTDQIAGTQRFRQMVLDTGGTPIDVAFSTDPPPSGAANLPGCQKTLTVGDKSIALPNIPITAHVPNGKISLRFSAVTAADDIYTGPDETFETVSLGEDDLRGASLQVVSQQSSGSKAKLDVEPSLAAAPLSIGGLKIGSKWIKLEIGPNSEKVKARANGQSIYNYDLIAAIGKNPILGWVFASILIPGLVVWVKTTCFPSKTQKN